MSAWWNKTQILKSSGSNKATKSRVVIKAGRNGQRPKAGCVLESTSYAESEEPAKLADVNETTNRTSAKA